MNNKIPIIIAVIIFLILAGIYIYSQKNDSEFADVIVTRVIDGDTFKVRLPCADAVLCKDISVRVKGVDCPEMRGKKKNPEKYARAKAAKEFTKNFLDGKQIMLLSCQRDKYFRLVCDVFADRKSLAAALLKNGHAVPYDGKKKRS